MSAESAAKALRRYHDLMKQEAIGKVVDFVGCEADPTWKDANDLILADAFAFLLAVIYDQGQRAESAWRYPYILQGRLGHLSPREIADMRLIDLDNLFAEYPRLRYWRMGSARTLRAAEMVCSRYGGDASNIWLRGQPTPREIHARLEEFDGIAQKKASMAANILIRDLGHVKVPTESLAEIDVSYDRHVRRVFLRAGLTKVDEEDAMVEAARRLSPDYPGALDFPAWVIGREYCANTSPKCEQCPIYGECARLLSTQ